MIPSGLVYSLPNIPPSVTNFQGPVIFSREKLENINCIIDPTQDRGGLFLGDTIAIKRTDYLIKHNIQAVLSCAPEAIFINSGDPNVNVISTKFISAMDNLNYDIGQHFQETFEFIQDNLSKKQNMLVHCHAGVSRSAAIVIAYVMKKLGLSLESAMEVVKSRRPRIRPNQRFRASLKKYQQTINLNQYGGNLSQIQYKQMKETSNSNNYSSTNLYSFTERPSANTNFERVSQPVDLYSKSRKNSFSKKQQEVRYQPSGLSITQLLMKTDMDTNSQRQLQYKLNQFSTQLQNQTNSLFGREQAPKNTIKNINEVHYNAKPYSYKDVARSWQPPYCSYGSSSYGSSQNPNPERIQYRPVQIQSVRSSMQKQMSLNKPKATVVQGGLPDSYKSIAGMMAPKSSRYEIDYQKRYY